MLRRPSKALCRSYHATPRREILPVLGAVTVFVIGRYSWRALKRMDAEWEDYQWELQQYEKSKARDAETPLSKTVAIDFGSVYSKLAVSYPKPELVVTREGDRYIFNGILYDEDAGTGNEAILRGRFAMEKFHFPSNASQCSVLLPWVTLDTDQAQTIVNNVLGPSLDEVLVRLGFGDDNTAPDSTPLRSVVTVPANYLYSDSYRNAFADLAPVFVPDPVAAIWGAQHASLLPSEQDKKGRTTVVVDIGGLITQLSLVQKDVVIASVAFPWGGERWVQLIIDLLQKEGQSDLSDGRSLTALQVHARNALAELSSRTRVHVHVPYLFPDPTKHHLDTEVARQVVEQAIMEDVRDVLVAAAHEKSALSSSLPNPTNLASFWTSALTQLLELSAKTPMDVDHFLLVGGASRFPIVQSSFDVALYNILGPTTGKFILPEKSLIQELTVTGASTMLPSYGYSVDDGLFRLE